MENFEELANTYKPMIHKIIRSLHIYKNKDEFFQLGLISLWEAQSNYKEDKGTFLNYAYSYIRGRFLTEMAKQNKVEECLDYPKEAFWDTIFSPDHGQSNFPVELEDYYDILSKNEQKWLYYTCIVGLKTNEIAEKEGVSPSLVKKWRKNAREKIRKQLDAS